MEVCSEVSTSCASSVWVSHFLPPSSTNIYQLQMDSHLDRICTPYRPRSSKYHSAAEISKVYPHYHYQIYFKQAQGATAARELDEDIRRSILILFRSAKPQDQADKGRWMTPKHQRFLEGWPLNPTRSVIFSEEEIQQYVQTYQRNGFQSSLYWYCTDELNWRDDGELPKVIKQPALMITCGKDRVLPPVMSAGMEDWVPLLERGHVEDAAHWVLTEQPEQVNQILLLWLQRSANGKIRCCL